MLKVNMLEAKTNLSKLVEAVESGKETEIIIARNGKPVARLVAAPPANRRLGLLDGKFPDFSLEDLNAHEDEIGYALYGPDLAVGEEGVGEKQA